MRQWLYGKRWEIGLATLTFLTYWAALLTPTLSANAAGFSVVEDFCDNHNKICNQYQYYYDYYGTNYDDSLKHRVKFSENSATGVFSFTAAVIDCLLICILAVGTKALYNCYNNYRRNSESQPLTTQSSLNADEQSSSNGRWFSGRGALQQSADWSSDEPRGRCQLFKRNCNDFFKKVLPSPLQFFQLVSMGLIVFGSGTFLLSMSAAITKSSICSNSYESDYDCSAFFPHLNASDLDAVEQLSNDVYATMLGTGIPLGAIASILAAFGVMTMLFCLKGRMAQAEVEAKENVSLANYSVQL